MGPFDARDAIERQHAFGQRLHARPGRGHATALALRALIRPSSFAVVREPADATDDAPAAIDDV